ncbi:MAG: type II 3-dehydroquinate dehydratase [Rhodospirillales bacterium]
MAHVVYILNGPNLNLLGTREPEVYGHETLADLGARCAQTAESLGLKADFRQTNSEGELVDWIQEAREKAAGLIINAAGLSHTSVAVLDALRAFEGPSIEVHLSNIYAREEYRRHSYLSEGVTGVVCGLGAQGYDFALRGLADRLGAGKN